MGHPKKKFRLLCYIHIGNFAHPRQHLYAQCQYCSFMKCLNLQGKKCCVGTGLILKIESSGWLVNFPLPLRHLLCNTADSWVGHLELCGIMQIHWMQRFSHSCKHTCHASFCNLDSSDMYLPNFSHLKDKHLALPSILAPSIVKGESVTAKRWLVQF